MTGYIADYEVYVNGKVTWRGNLAIDIEGVPPTAQRLLRVIKEKVEADPDVPAGSVRVVGLFKL